MPYALLRYENPSLPPEARWFLWRWTRCIGLDQAVTCSVRALVKRLGITLRQGQTTLNLLKAQGVIIATSKPAGRGRPHYEYRLSQKLMDALATCEEAPPPLVADIDRLGAYSHQAAETTGAIDTADDAQNVTIDDATDQQSRNISLTLANRWVLMVLLAHADENGTVIDMPALRMQRLAGVTPNRWQSQRRKLHEFGVLARYQSGRPERWQGRTLPVVHHLDLTQPCLARPIVPAIRLLLIPSGIDHHDTSPSEAMVTALLVAAQTVDDPEKQDIYSTATAILPARTYTDVERVVVRALPRTPGMVGWLRGHVHLATTQLLNTSWKVLGSKKASHEIVDTVLQGLEQALNHPLIELGFEAMKQKTDACHTVPGDAQDDGAPQSLTGVQAVADYRACWARLLYGLAHHLAGYLHDTLLSLAPALDLGRLTYELVAVTHPYDGSDTKKRKRNCWQLCGSIEQLDECGEEYTQPILVSVIAGNPEWPQRPLKRGSGHRRRRMSAGELLE